MLGRSALFQRAASATIDGTIDLVARSLRPFILRRTKQQVARDLPAKTESTITCDLSAAERSLYEGLRRHYRESVLKRVELDGVTRSRMHTLECSIVFGSVSLRSRAKRLIVSHLSLARSA